MEIIILGKMDGHIVLSMPIRYLLPIVGSRKRSGYGETNGIGKIICKG